MSSSKDTSSKESCTAPDTGPGSIAYALAKVFNVEDAGGDFAAWLLTQDKPTQDKVTNKSQVMHTVTKGDASRPMEVDEMAKCQTRDLAKWKLQRYANIISQGVEFDGYDG
jgi:hypothetical protein